MTRFVTIHRAPGLSRDELQSNARPVLEGLNAQFEQMWVDMFSGFIVTVYQAESQAALESEFERLGFPWDEVHPVQVQLDRPGLEQLVAASA
ncbi:MAG: nickel-binding protein [Chloroflexota bacterium]